jgi:NAD(P)-dependent dehydrogenase (short-subunit alcohol dehydrogenase family)
MNLDPLFSVEGRIVIVTGGMGQLGRRFTHTLRERGARVVVLDLDTRNNREEDENVLYVTADVTNAQSLQNALDTIEETWGAPHALINNAAIDSPPDAPAEENGPFENYPEESWDRVMTVNTKGVFLCSRTFGSAMAKAGRGSIVNISSIYGLVSPDQRIYEYRGDFFKPIAYSASKSTLLNMTRYLATYWAPRGVRVNTLTFAGVFNNQDARFLERYCAKVPLGRMARADEYDAAVVFLVSDASSYMTGSNMIIDGGWTAW